LVHDSQWPRRGSDGKEHWLSGPLESGSTTAAPTPPQPRSGAARTRLEHEDWADIFPLGIPLTSRSIPRKTWLSHNPRALIQSAFFCPFLPRPSLPFSAYICNGGTERPAESFCKPDFWGAESSRASLADQELTPRAESSARGALTSHHCRQLRHDALPHIKRRLLSQKADISAVKEKITFGTFGITTLLLVLWDFARRLLINFQCELGWVLRNRQTAHCQYDTH